MSATWSGPGRALDFHLKLFERVSRTTRWSAENQDREVDTTKVPLDLLQRLKLMSVTSHIKLRDENDIVVEGSTVATLRDRPSLANSPENVHRTQGLLSQEYTFLNEGETHYVSHHVMSTLAKAAESAEPEALFETDLPVKKGLLVFEYPLIISDLHPETGELLPDLRIPIRAIGWSEADVFTANRDEGKYMPHRGIFYVLYTDNESFKDVQINDVYKLGKGGIISEQIVESYEQSADFRDLLRVWPVDTSGWAYGTSWYEAEGLVDLDSTKWEQGAVHSTVSQIRRWLMAYFRWTFQRIIVSQDYKLRKPELKRALRAKMPTDGHIKVIRLRRELEHERRGGDEPSFVHTHRWIVRGHWRRQWYKSLGPHHLDDGSFNQSSHRLIWIDPHESGNPFGQLIVGHNVTAAVR